MSAIDKPLEDLYAYLKSHWWGIPMVVFAIVLASAFAIWNSLPNPTKERILTELSSPSEARAVMDSPIPLPSEGSGTSQAKVTLPPQPMQLLAQIRGEATAHISDGGWMALNIYVSGVSNPCGTSKVYKNRTSDNVLSAVVTCNVFLLANTQYEFRLDAPNYNADARTASLRVNYLR